MDPVRLLFRPWFFGDYDSGEGRRCSHWPLKPGARATSVRFHRRSNARVRVARDLPHGRKQGADCRGSRRPRGTTVFRVVQGPPRIPTSGPHHRKTRRAHTDRRVDQKSSFRRSVWGSKILRLRRDLGRAITPLSESSGPYRTPRFSTRFAHPGGQSSLKEGGTFVLRSNATGISGCRT
jgi:hypothetical protein